MRTSLIAIATLVCAGAQAQAATIPIVNPGFEDDLPTVAAPGAWSDAAPTGWQDPAGGDNSNFIEYISGFSSEGALHVGFDANEFGMLYQDLSIAWAPNTTYTLTVGAGNRNGTSFAAGTGRFGFGSSNDSAPSASTPNVLSVYSEDIFTGTYATAVSTFADVTLTYSTGAVAPAGNIRISVQNLDTSTRLHVDNFRLDGTTIPEPSSLATLGLAAGLLMRRRRA